MKKRPRKSFRNKITLWIVLSSTLPLIILGILSFSFINNYNESVREDEFNNILRYTETTMKESLKSYIDAVEMLPKNEEFMEAIAQDSLSVGNEKIFNRIMHSLMGNKSNFLQMHYVDAQGSYVYSTTKTPKFYNLPLYENWGIFRFAKDKENVNVYPNTFRYKNGYQNALSLIKPVVKSGEKRGFIILDISTEMLSNVLKSVEDISYEPSSLIITSLNDIILYNESEYVGTDKLSRNMIYQKFSDDNNVDKVIVRSTTDNELGLNYYILIDDVLTNTQIQNFLVYLFIIIIIVGLSSVFIGLFVGQEISDPIVKLAQKIQSFNLFDTIELEDDTEREDEVGIIADEFLMLMKRMQKYYYENLEKQDLLRLSEIKALLSQINPHFLYNTLDSIKWKAKLNETEDIAFMVTELSVLLKGSMDTKTTLVSVREEIRFIESYINIQKSRYGDRFEYILDAEESVMEYMIPKLILQPLVENALIHGIEPLEQIGIVQVSAWEDEDLIYFSIADNGVGSDLDYKDLFEETSNENIGLVNVDKRIKLYYGEEYGLRWESSPDKGTVVFIVLNKKMKGEH